MQVNNNEIEEKAKQALELLAEHKDKELTELFDALHPVELVSLINAVGSEQQEELIHHLTGLDQLAGFITYANDEIREIALKLIDDQRIAAVIRRQEIDDAANFLATLPRRRQVRILRRLAPKRAKEITTLLAYDKTTAGSIMTPSFLSLEKDLIAKKAIKRLQEGLQNDEIDTGTDISYVYVVNSQKEIQGVFSLRELLSAEPNTVISEIMNTSIVSISPESDQEIAAKLIADYDLAAIPVVSLEDKKMLGIITVDDVIDVIEDELTEDLLKLAGTEDQDTIGAPITVAVKSRIPWLLASWLGGICGAMLLGNFSSTLEKVVALAFFMPVVFGMGGNVGSQSSTITVRGLATGKLRKHKIFRRLFKEIRIGIFLGIVFGILLSSASFFIYRDPNLSITVGTSIFVTMACAASLGSMLPVFFERLGFDPAVASGPLVTTTTDFLSIAIYFSIATMFL